MRVATTASFTFDLRLFWMLILGVEIIWSPSGVYTGDEGEGPAWQREAPKEKVEFFFIDRRRDVVRRTDVRSEPFRRALKPLAEKFRRQRLPPLTTSVFTHAAAGSSLLHCASLRCAGDMFSCTRTPDVSIL